MNPDDNKDNIENKPDNSTPAALPDRDKTKKVENSEESPSSETENSKKEISYCPQVSVVDKTPDKWNKTNTTALVAAGINIVIVFAYALLYMQAQSASEETKREFKVINTPYLALGNVNVWNYGVGQQIKFEYQILSLTSHPIHIYKGKRGFCFDTTQINRDSTDIAGSRVEKVNTYITDQHPHTEIFINDSPTTQNNIDNFLKGRDLFFEDLEYTNDFDDKPRHFFFIIRLANPRGDTSRVGAIVETVATDNRTVSPNK